MNKKYEVSFEVAGPFAMFVRPDTGGTPTSYPVPTWSAAKGLFEAVAFLKDGAAWICPTRVEVCRRAGEKGGRISFQKYTTNYGGPLRKENLFNKGLISGGSSMQLFATVLRDVCFRIHGVIDGPEWKGRINPRHYLKDLFERRLLQGRCYRTPCLGWSEFTCTYWGPTRNRNSFGPNNALEENESWRRYCKRWNLPFCDSTEVDDSLSLEIPSMLLAMWDRPNEGNYRPFFTQGQRDGGGNILHPVLVEKGVLKYDVPTDWIREEVRNNA